jgi:hypothetical protein
MTTATLSELLEQVHALVQDVRATSLWFLAEDYVPTDRDQAIRVLRAIERSADRDTYTRARQLRTWLSRMNSEQSAASSPERESSAERAT